MSKPALALSALALLASAPAFAGTDFQLDGGTLYIDSGGGFALQIVEEAGGVGVYQMTDMMFGFSIEDRDEWDEWSKRLFLLPPGVLTEVHVSGSSGREMLNLRVPGVFLSGTTEAGDDVMIGMGGCDLHTGDDQDYVGMVGGGFIDAGPHDDLVHAWTGPYTVYGNGGWDEIRTGGWNDHIYGGEGNDLIYGGVGNDVIYGQDGEDELHGGDGDDFLDGGDRVDSLWGGLGDDQLYGGRGNDTLQGGEDDDLLSGQRGEDLIKDHDGRNAVTGGRDNDTIEVTSYGSTVSGSGGNDRCESAYGVTYSSCERMF